MATLSVQDQLNDRLSRLEAALETPAVPGELEGWVADVRDGLETLEPLLEEAGSLREEQLKRIEQNDLGLAQRVKLLREDGECILADYRQLVRDVVQLAEASARDEPDERRHHDDVAAVVETGIDWIIRIRKLNQAMRTWAAESVARDRGTVD